MKKEQAIKQVDECISSIFSKEDVKQIITNIETELTDLKDFLSVLDDAFDRASDELEVEVNSVDWEIEGNQNNVYVTNVELEDYSFKDSSVTSFIERLKVVIKEDLEDETDS